jgi:hypothetical protein
LIGLRGINVDAPEMLQSAWQQALASDIPVVLEVKTDPEVSPLPPHFTLQQAKNFSIALAKAISGRGRRDQRRRAAGAGVDLAEQGIVDKKQCSAQGRHGHAASDQFGRPNGPT